MSQRTSRERTLDYARGLTASELLAKLRRDGIDHPGGLAQAIGVSGRGTAQEVASEIVRQLPRIEEGVHVNDLRRYNTTMMAVDTGGEEVPQNYINYLTLLGIIESMGEDDELHLQRVKDAEPGAIYP